MVYVLAPLIRVGRCPAYRPRSTFVHSFTHVLRSAFTTFIHSVDTRIRSYLPPFTYTHLHTRPPLRTHTHAHNWFVFPVHHPFGSFIYIKHNASLMCWHSLTFIWHALTLIVRRFEKLDDVIIVYLPPTRCMSVWGATPHVPEYIPNTCNVHIVHLHTTFGTHIAHFHNKRTHKRTFSLFFTSILVYS